MNDTCYKAGSDEFTSSDTKDITGSISGIVGFESADSFSDYADKYNKQHKKEKQLNPEVKADCIKGAALLTNEAIKEGAIITLGSHMPNFSMSIKNKGDKFDHTYDAYDFGGSTFNETTGDCMNEIMPGGKYNEIYTAYLDTIVDYAKQVEGTILYRPFHENTGGELISANLKFSRMFTDIQKSILKVRVYITYFMFTVQEQNHLSRQRLKKDIPEMNM